MARKKTAKMKLNDKAKKQVISLLVISLVAVVIAVGYQALSHFYKGGGYISSINSNYTSGAIVGDKSQPQYEISDLDLKSQGQQVFLEWTNLGDKKVSYLVKHVDEKSPTSNLFDNGPKVYTSAVGTFTKPTSKKTAQGQQYYITSTPAIFTDLTKLKKAPQAIADSGRKTKSRYELKNLNKNNTYTFFVQTYYESKLVAESKKSIVFKAQEMTVAASAQKGIPFKDVPDDAWFSGYVKSLHNRGVIVGRDKFNPNDKVNRAEASKFVINALGIMPGNDDGKFAAQKFVDINENDWFAPYVGYMARKGWVQGVSSKKGLEFKGNDNVTRAEVLKMLIAATEKDLSGFGSHGAFSDVKGSDWFSSYVEYAFSIGIISDNNDRKFFPSRHINRAEIAKIISIFLEGGQPASFKPTPTITPPVT